MADLSKPIRNEDILRCVSHKQINGCEACGNRNFDIFNEVESKQRVVLTAPKLPGYDLDGASAIDVIAMMCTSCGTVRTIGRLFVANWIEANPK